jgi:hypothetical protein
LSASVLALKPLSGAKDEVWWFNEFASQEEMESVREAYKKNEAWNAALTRNQKEPLTGKPIEQLADSPQLDSRAWAAGRTRYVVVAMNPATHLRPSNRFIGRGSARYEILITSTRREAEHEVRGQDFVRSCAAVEFPRERMGGRGPAIMERAAMNERQT